MEISAPMRELRDRLDAMGVEWFDGSEDWGDGMFVHHTERTGFKGVEGYVASVTWGYRLHDGARESTTYGAPDKLECLFKPYDPEPVPMDVDMVLRITLGVTS